VAVANANISVMAAKQRELLTPALNLYPNDVNLRNVELLSEGISAESLACSKALDSKAQPTIAATMSAVQMTAAAEANAKTITVVDSNWGWVWTSLGIAGTIALAAGKIFLKNNTLGNVAISLITAIQESKDAIKAKGAASPEADTHMQDVLAILSDTLDKHQQDPKVKAVVQTIRQQKGLISKAVLATPGVAEVANAPVDVDLVAANSASEGHVVAAIADVAKDAAPKEAATINAVEAIAEAVRTPDAVEDFARPGPVAGPTTKVNV
jgi:hypothetical protein